MHHLREREDDRQRERERERETKQPVRTLENTTINKIKMRIKQI
jgi:hypothetical protein